MQNERTVTVDFLPDSPLRYRDHDAVVCIDVIRATTTMVTALALGRRVVPAGSVEEGRERAKALDGALLGGEVSGGVPVDFEIGNSPAALTLRTDVNRPLVLVSQSGTPLLNNASGCRAVYVACLRNLAVTAAWVAERYRRVAVLGAGSHGEMRCEDQMAVARLAGRLCDRGFVAENARSRDLIERWRGADVVLAGWGNSAEYLRKTGQVDDLQFVLDHIDDVNVVCNYDGYEVKAANRFPAAARSREQEAVRISALSSSDREHGMEQARG